MRVGNETMWGFRRVMSVILVTIGRELRSGRCFHAAFKDTAQRMFRSMQFHRLPV